MIYSLYCIASVIILCFLNMLLSFRTQYFFISVVIRYNIINAILDVYVGLYVIFCWNKIERKMVMVDALISPYNTMLQGTVEPFLFRLLFSPIRNLTRQSCVGKYRFFISMNKY